MSMIPYFIGAIILIIGIYWIQASWPPTRSESAKIDKTVWPYRPKPNQHVLQSDIDMIYSVSKETAADWWCELNAWKWPKELPNEEPEPDFLNYEPGRRSALMEIIRMRIGMKTISYHHNVVRRKAMTDAEFREWSKNDNFLQTCGNPLFPD